MAAKKAKRTKSVATKKVAAPKAAATHVHHEKQQEHSPIMQIGIAFIIIAALLLMFYVGSNYNMATPQ